MIGASLVALGVPSDLLSLASKFHAL